MLPVVQGLQLEHVHHLVEKVLGPERQRHAALGPACHDLPAEPVRKAHGLRRALPGPDLLQIPAPYRQGGYDAVHDFQRLEGSGDRPVLPARHDVVDPLFLRQEVAARRPAFQVLAPQLDQRLGHVPRPVFRKDDGQLAALVQGGGQVGGHLRPGKSPVCFADGVERGPPEALLHGPVLEQLLVCQVVCVVVQKHRQVSIQRQVFDGLVLILHILLHGLVYVLIGRRGCVGQLLLVPQEGRLLVRLRVSQRVRLLQLVPDFLRGIGSSEIPHKGPGPHNVVRVIEHVRHGVHILLESFRNVRIQKFSLAVSVLEKAVPRHIRLEIFRSPRNGGGELPDLPVNPHALQGVVEPLLGLLALEMGRVPPDEADGLVAVGHQKIVGRVVELVEQLPVLLHRVPDDDGVRALQPFLGFQPPAVLNRQPPLVRPQVEFPRFIHGGVDLRLPPLRKVVFSCQLPGVLDVLRRVLNIPAPLHGVHGVLRRPALDHQLHQGPFLLVQSPVFSILVQEGPDLVVHSVHEADALRLVVLDRPEEVVVDLVALGVAEDPPHIPFRGPVPHDDGRRDLRLGVVHAVHQPPHPLVQVPVDLGALLPDQVVLHGLLRPVVVRQLHHRVRVHAGRDVRLAVDARRHAGGEVLLRIRGLQPSLRPLDLLSDGLGRPVILDQLLGVPIQAHAVGNPDAQVLQSVRALEFLPAPVPHPFLRRGLQGRRVVVDAVEALRRQRFPPVDGPVFPPLVQPVVLLVAHAPRPVQIAPPALIRRERGIVRRLRRGVLVHAVADVLVVQSGEGEARDLRLRAALHGGVQVRDVGIVVLEHIRELLPGVFLVCLVESPDNGVQLVKSRRLFLRC